MSDGHVTVSVTGHVGQARELELSSHAVSRSFSRPCARRACMTRRRIDSPTGPYFARLARFSQAPLVHHQGPTLEHWPGTAGILAGPRLPARMPAASARGPPPG